MDPTSESIGHDLTGLLAGLSIVNGLVETSADRRKKQWEENCKRFTILLDDWSSGKISRKGLPRDGFGPHCFKFRRENISRILKGSLGEINGSTCLKECLQSNYTSMMRFLILAEEIYQAVEMQKYKRIVNLEIKWDDEMKTSLRSARIHLPNFANWSPSLVANDLVFLHNDSKSFYMAVKIFSVNGDYIYLPRHQIRCLGEELLQAPLHASFLSCGVPFQYCENAAIKLGSQKSLQSLFFTDPDPVLKSLGLARLEESKQVLIDFERTNAEEMVAELNLLNESQRNAVINIIKAECRPKPYILFGPPGTGKSHTLVAAVRQIYFRSIIQSGDFRCYQTLIEQESRDSPSHNSNGRPLGFETDGQRAKILVTVNSNTCADELYGKLEKSIPSAKIVRLRAGDLSPASDRDQDIIVTTNIKSGSIKELRFDYILLDEAGHANEAESLVPLTSLKPTGCLVLAGDPKQLGPVVMSREAASLGFETSLLDRLFNSQLYQRSSITNKYDQRYITMLQECYRCDTRILAPCNKLFYGSDLICRNGTPAGLLKLLRLTGPIQTTKRSYGTEERPGYSTSWRNLAEADACVNLIIRLYNMGIEPEQIGVTTPYKLQVREMRNRLKSALNLHSADLTQRFHRYEYIKKRWTVAEKQVLDSEDDNAKRVLYESLKTRHYVRVNNQFSQYEPSLYDGPVQLYEREVSAWLCKVDSIDAFQGNEKEIMIISTVRTDPNIHRLEFLNDARRFNVAVSRAKWLLFVIGDADALKLGKYWPALMEDSKSDIDNWPV